MAIEEAGHKVILPVWHEISKAALAERYPILADRLAADTADGITKVVSELMLVILDPVSGSPAVAERAPREDQRKQIRQMLLDYARDGRISDRVLKQALEVLKRKPEEAEGDLGRSYELLRELFEKRLELGDFVEAWNLAVADVPATVTGGRRNRKIALVALLLPVAVLVWWAVSQRVRTHPPGRRPGELQTNPQDGLRYAWIPAGSFQMGCSSSDIECTDQEKPAHPVTITRGFWLGQTPVTVGAYKRFSEATGRKSTLPPAVPGINQDENYPVVNVTWQEATQYCTWSGCRLPTEAEWEYAARAGSIGERPGDLYQIAWFAGNSMGQPHPVATREPNPWGLFDMLGNEWEWCADWFAADWYQKREAKDPAGPPAGEYRALRGGAWDSAARNVRVSYRVRLQPTDRVRSMGFRCVRETVP
jgi:formylglycine-generating enzyme required for sulfatase activity